MDNPNTQTNVAIKYLALSQSLGHTQDFVSDNLASITKFKSQSFEILISKLNIFL